MCLLIALYDLLSLSMSNGNSDDGLNRYQLNKNAKKIIAM